jgi:hypothetical protein
MTNQKYFGFLTLHQNEKKDSYLGAILVVDVRGRPAEFRVTFPIKPTAIQRPLYGDSLEPYIGVELCGKQLINSISHNLELIIVDQRFLLEIRNALEFPVIHVSRAGEVIEVSQVGVAEPVGNKKELISTSGRFQPIVIGTLPTEPDDLEIAYEFLNQFFEDTDLLEPFERIENALGILIAQDDRFQ